MSPEFQNLLAIDTSSEACSVALSWRGELSFRDQHVPLKHAELLLPAVHSLLSEAGIALSQLDAIVFGQGPGSFTSLRIGIGVVQGLAWGAELPVVPVSSLAAVALTALTTARKEDSLFVPKRVFSAMDARMDEVFYGLFAVSETGVLSVVGEESVAKPSAISIDDPVHCLGAGNGFARYDELVQMGHLLPQVQADAMPVGESLIGLARQWLVHHEPVPASRAQPVYIRNKVAEKPKPA